MIVDVLEPMIAEPIHREFGNKLTKEERHSIIGHALLRESGKEAVIDVMQKYHFNLKYTQSDKCESFLNLLTWVQQFDLGLDWLGQIIKEIPIYRKEVELWYQTHGSFIDYVDKHYVVPDWMEIVFGDSYERPKTYSSDLR